MRIYQGDSVIQGDSRPHTFIEVKPDSFLEVELPTLTDQDITQGFLKRVRAFVRTTNKRERETGCGHIKMTYRYFASIYPIPNLHLVCEF